MIYIYLLELLSFLLIFIAFFKNLKIVRILSFVITSFIFLVVFYLSLKFDKTLYAFQNVYHIFWNETWNVHYSLGVDGLSLLFLLLTSFLIPLCILYSWNQFPYSFRYLLFLLILIEIILFNFFLVLDFFFFFLFFEFILIPMFLLIGFFGSRQRRIHATFQFFIFTMFGSFFMLTSFLVIYIMQGSSDLILFYNSTFNYDLEILLWIFLFFSLSIKIPLFPLHIWLPEAHVEAPTVGSVILAGVLLKMGSYGMLRFLIPVFTFSNKFFSPLIIIFCFLSIYYVSLITFCQIDLKKLIAYSSISHMGYVTLSLFTYDLNGIQGSIFLMLSHGIVSSLLFFLIGMLYDRYKTRIIFFYQSLNSFMPVFCFIFFIATLANVGFPGTVSFIGEFLIMLSFFGYNKVVFLVNSIAFIVSAVYSFWLFNRIFFSLPIKNFIFGDISRREFFVLFPFVALIFIFGIYPSFILNIFEFYVLSLLQF